MCGKMAIDPRLTLSNQQKIVKLAKSTTKTWRYLSDQFIEKLGTSRRSEVRGQIGDSKEPQEKLEADYLNGL